ncbi:MAG: Omp28-related outer membrane protein [Flavobacteriales bacterium]|nr:Omp28-related outer membrane protein [Flavobacteriales bacterium]
MRSFVLFIAFFTGTALAAQNAYLTNGFVPRYWKANTDYVINVRVRNSNSTTPLLSFRVDWNWNNGPVQTGNMQSTTGIVPGQYWPYPHPIPFNKPESAGTLKVWVVGTGDTDHSNDTLTFPVGVLANWTAKSVLIEQYTGTWCQFCPNPNSTTNDLDADPFIVVAKHHNNDDFAAASSVAYWSQFNAEYSPAGVMEQEEFGTLQDDAAYVEWGARAEQRKLGVSPVEITVVPGFNDWTRQLTVDLTATFTAAQSGDFTVNAYIVEDNVAGLQTGAAPGYIHQQLVREVLGGTNGTSGVIPAFTTASATYTHQYTFAVPTQWNADNLRIVATVTEHRPAGTQTVNVTDADFVLVGVEEHGLLNVRAYPNPSSGALWIELEDATPALVRLLGADGRVVIDQRASGDRFLLEGFEALAPGAYLLRVQQGSVFSEQRVMRY